MVRPSENILVLCACVVVALAGAGGRAGAAPSAPAASAPPPQAAEIREIVALLVDDDVAVRRAASDRLVAIGDPALVVLEEEIRAGRQRPNGQVKIALLALRAQRLDRQWNERIAALTAKPWRQTFVQVVDGRPAGEFEYRLERVPPKKPGAAAGGDPAPAGPPALSLEVDERRGERRARTRATLGSDRTFSPATVDGSGSKDGRDVRATIAAGHLVGAVGAADVDRPAPPPMALDLALPLVALAMPREVGAELVCTVLHADDLSVSPTATVRCVRRDERSVEGKSSAVFVYELSGDGAARHVEIGEGDRVLLAELRPGLTIRRR